MLEAQSKLSKKEISYELKLVEGAYSAFLEAKYEDHDRLIRQAVIEFGTHVDVVVLAQASMARVLAILATNEMRVPVLSSPRLALQQIRVLLGNLSWG
jgi:hypothetical protein